MKPKPTILITGGSSGIGRGIASYFAAMNKYKIALLSTNIMKLNKTIEICQSLNPNVEAIALQCDVTDHNNLRSMIKNCHNTFGPLTVLINSAGVSHTQLISNEMNIEAVNKCIDINLKGVINSCIFSVDYLKETKKKYPSYPVSIININSISSLDKETDPKWSIYVASKFGVRGFTQCLFNELREFGIKVTDIAPDWIDTPLVDQYVNKNPNDRILSDQIMSVKDIAKTIEYILDVSHKAVPTQITLYTQYDARKRTKILNSIESKL
eukprot:342828_1